MQDMCSGSLSNTKILDLCDIFQVLRGFGPCPVYKDQVSS